MKNFFSVSSKGTFISSVVVIIALVAMIFSACSPDDPKPVNEEEVITTLEVTLVPEAGGTPVVLRFFDADGEHGSIAPEITVSGPLQNNSRYSAIIVLQNETEEPAVSISDEVIEEAEAHLFCFEISGDIGISYEDEDANGLPLGILTSWETGAPGATRVTVILRHQPGTKTGDCPGGGDTDVQVAFDLNVE